MSSFKRILSIKTKKPFFIAWLVKLLIFLEGVLTILILLTSNNLFSDKTFPVLEKITRIKIINLKNFIENKYQYTNEKIQNSYKKSGVNIPLANKLVKHISIVTKKSVKKGNNTFDKLNIGGFGSLFDLSTSKIKDPVIVSCTDGVGTKVELANKYKKFDKIGIDLVAMCVNDLIVQGAKPLFLDYIATGKLNLIKTKKF